VTNTGTRAGSAVLQLYISAPTSRITRPVKELHGFEKVHLLGPGETKRVEIPIDKYAGALWDEMEQAWLEEKGSYHVLVGLSSVAEDLVRTGSFDIAQERRWLGL
jgi:beta-glucosidase